MEATKKTRTRRVNSAMKCQNKEMASMTRSDSNYIDTPIWPSNTDSNEYFVANKNELNKEEEAEAVVIVEKVKEENMLSDNLETKKPPPNWFIVQEVINRQIGSNPLFQRRFCSSLHAVNRLEFKYKLHDVEDVNALSFNQKGNLLARASGETISIWDWAARKKCCCLPNGYVFLISEVKWLPLDVENFMVTRTFDGDIHLLDLEYKSWKRLLHYKLSLHDSRRQYFMNDRSLAVHPEIPYVVFSTGNGSISSIDIREDTPKVYDLRNISKPLYQLWTTKYDKDYYGYGRGTIAMYNHDGTEILTSCNSSRILLFDKSMWSCEGNSNHTLFESNQFRSVPGVPADIADRYSRLILGINFFGPRSEFIISASDGGDIFIYDKEKRTAAQWLREDYKFVDSHHCLGHPHIPILATAFESSVLIWMPSRNEDRKKFRTVPPSPRGPPSPPSPSTSEERYWTLPATPTSQRSPPYRVQSPQIVRRSTRPRNPPLRYTPS
ncbi:PREDICTED: DDB1- and CUL4-associated factor 8-like [Cyphomyrmex costatus]|uniref:DDB1- and CUL4-associated factor 8-like n=1 Tax=Cyphomyrmex costatus TaxID=456900 RepID=UPI0008522CB8|nr:PREDICTED: DDB1- and CUL4-associated factor 8-like [Cyphomyrmex costatus]